MKADFVCKVKQQRLSANYFQQNYCRFRSNIDIGGRINAGIVRTKINQFITTLLFSLDPLFSMQSRPIVLDETSQPKNKFSLSFVV